MGTLAAVLLVLLLTGHGISTMPCASADAPADPAPKKSLATRTPEAPNAAGASIDEVELDALPGGTVVLPFENLEGIILVRGRLAGSGDRDTSGLLVFDSGAGFLAIGFPLARSLGLVDPGAHEAMGLADLPLRRLEIGSLQIDQLGPVLTVDIEVVRQVSDRPILGLLGTWTLQDRAVFVDYGRERVVLVPAGGRMEGAGGGREPVRGARGEKVESDPSVEPATEANQRGKIDKAVGDSRKLLDHLLSDRAQAVPFRIAGDGKILVRGRVSRPRPPRYSEWLDLIVDTGATKCVLFADVMADDPSGLPPWPTIRGLLAPTLYGSADAEVARIPVIQIEGADRAINVENVDVALLRSNLARALERASGSKVHGLLGYSYLKRFRVAIDYPREVLWLDPRGDGWDDRPHEYSNVGVQLERRDQAVRVIAVVEGSPAARAGVEKGDEILSVDGRSAADLDVLALTRRLEGAPGTRVRVKLRRGMVERTYTFTRRRLL